MRLFVTTGSAGFLITILFGINYFSSGRLDVRNAEVGSSILPPSTTHFFPTTDVNAAGPVPVAVVPAEARRQSANPPLLSDFFINLQ